MINEQKIRAHIRKVLLEAERTRKGGQGRYKKEITQTGALAKSNPGELMKRLQVASVTGNDDIEKMFDLLDKVTSAPTAMSQAYEKPLPRQDKGTGFKGVRVPVQVLSPRDARKYIEHTVHGALGSRMVRFDSDIQIEIIGNDVLVYFSPRPLSWGRGSAKGTAKPKPPAEKQEEAPQHEREILGEPDINPDRDNEDSDEASGSAAVSGPLTPLGTGPTYPDKPKKKPKTPAEITGRAFGGAKPVRKKK